MSRSAIDRTRGQSVLEVLEEDRVLMLRRLTEGNDADEASRLGMDD